MTEHPGPTARPSPVIVLGLFALAYTGCIELSHLLREVPSIVPIFWPASGVAAAAIVYAGRDRRARVLTGVLVIGVVTGLLHGDLPILAIGLAGSATAGTLMFAMVMSRLDANRQGMARWGSLLVSAAASAFVAGTLSASVAGPITGVHVADAAQRWFVAEFVGMLIVAPMLIPSSSRVQVGTHGVRRLVEALLIATALAAEIALVFLDAQHRPLAFLVIPALLASAVRLGRTFTAWLMGVTAMASTGFTLAGSGVFGALADSEGVWVLQIFLATTTIAAMTLAVAVEDGQRVSVQLGERELVFRRNFDDALVGMMMLEFDPGTRTSRIAQANTSARRILALPAGDLPQDSRSTSWRDLLPEAQRAMVTTVLIELAEGEREMWQGELEHLVDGEQRWFDVSLATMRSTAADGRLQLTLQLVDVSSRKLAESQLTEMAMHDSLTGLPNRVLMHDRLNVALANAGRQDLHVGVLFLDLDDFKTINDASGHHVGDDVLKEVARRLVHAVRPGDTVCRMGGDEFVVLCPNLPDVETASRVSDRILHALHDPVRVRDRSWVVDVSVGISLAGAGDNADAVLREADTAMYAAKRKGKGRAEVFEQEMHARASRQANLAPRLRQALNDQEFRLHFQPVVDLASSRTVGVEALIRWQHPQRGLLPPSEWLDVVEKSDLVVELGRWVLQEGCRWGAMWQETLGHLAPVVHVNVSARHLNNRSFLGDVQRALTDTGCSPRWLVLEVTETHLLTVSNSLHRDLERLRVQGVKIAADDYGTGYSALSQVIELDVDILKIDKSFVMAMDSSRRANAVVQAVVGLGQALGLEVVAEGVERPEHAESLLRMGCMSAQGYLWSPARPAEDVAGMLTARGGIAVQVPVGSPVHPG